MNKTEAEYELLLRSQVSKGEMEWYKFEGLTLKLANDTRYTPDFAVMACDGELQMHEVKGCRRKESESGEISFKPNIEDAGWVKVKTAAALFPFRFFVCYKTPIGWLREEVKV